MWGYSGHHVGVGIRRLVKKVYETLQFLKSIDDTTLTRHALAKHK